MTVGAHDLSPVGLTRALTALGCMCRSRAQLRRCDWWIGRVHEPPLYLPFGGEFGLCRLILYLLGCMQRFSRFSPMREITMCYL